MEQKMRAANKLTSLHVKKASLPGLYGDGHGLYLQVSQFGTKSWLFRFMRDGAARKMGLGAIHTISLAEARQRAADARKTLLDGHDPIDDRAAARAETRLTALRAVSFRHCAERYVASNEAGWKNAKHREQWKNTLAAYAYPIIGNLPVSTIDTALVLQVIEPIWTKKPDTASRLRGRIETVLSWAAARKFRPRENPAQWKGHLDKLLPKPGRLRAVKHHKALGYGDLPEFMAQLRTRDNVSASALEFTILCATRTGETINARWLEFNLDDGLWTIPPERTKTGKEHRVPLSDRALAILQNLPHEAGTEFVFPGARSGKPLSSMAMLELLRVMSGNGSTVHGFRSTFRDWAAERTNYQNYIVEMALAHAVGDKVEAAYRRGELLEKRRRLMAEWAKYCNQSPESATLGKVHALRAVRS